MSIRVRLAGGLLWAAAMTLAAGRTGIARGQDFVPGSGHKIAEVGDDFEDPNWTYNYNLPKSSQNIDHQSRPPFGASANGRWFEPALRGQPDVIKRVATPPGGLPGSKGSLLIKTLWSGIPGQPSYKPQQDDLVADVEDKIGTIAVGRMPSVVVRVFVPPFDEWEKRTGNSFGFRCGAFANTRKGNEPYWPGMFICLYSKVDSESGKDSARFIIRSDESGHDVPGPWITKTGWWTIGMSFGQNGQVNYYIKPGVEDLTIKDHVASFFPYGMKAERFETFFFNVVNMDDGKSWSTSWIVDDPTIYVRSGGGREGTANAGQADRR